MLSEVNQRPMSVQHVAILRNPIDGDGIRRVCACLRSLIESGITCGRTSLGMHGAAMNLSCVWKGSHDP
jgi:hypothetical protein